MPSSADRKRLEIPIFLHDRLVEIAIDEDRTISSVVQEVITAGLGVYSSRSPFAKVHDRLMDRARNALDYAREETVPFNHGYIGTEHLLLGLLRESDGVAARVLTTLGVDLHKTREAIGYLIGPGRGRVPDKENLPYAPRLRKTLRLAEEITDELGNHYIGTEHFLLALIRVRDGMAARILDHFGVLDQVRPEVLRIIAFHQPLQGIEDTVTDTASA